MAFGITILLNHNEYDLEVGTNETKNNYITVFVNFRVVGSDGSLLGVIGVGLQVNSLGDTINSYERDYGMSVHIINVMGAETSFKGNSDIFISEDDLQKRVGITVRLQLKESKTQACNGTHLKAILTDIH